MIGWLYHRCDSDIYRSATERSDTNRTRSHAAIAEKAARTALSGIVMQHADDRYSRRGNFGGSFAVLLSLALVLGLELSLRTNFESLALALKVKSLALGVKSLALALALSKSPWPWPNRSLALQDL